MKNNLCLQKIHFELKRISCESEKVNLLRTVSFGFLEVSFHTYLKSSLSI